MHWLLTLIVLLACSVTALADEPPPVFARMTFTEAKAASGKDGRLLVVKATAVWCGPCLRMNTTTWRDETVEKWFAEHGRAIEFDVDKDEALARDLAIEAMPTMIAFKHGKEFDRIVGYKGPEDLLAWLEAVQRGERLSDKLEAQARKLQAGGGGISMQERLQGARGLVQAGKLDLATDEYTWLWENITKVEPAMLGVRTSFMASDMERLASRHAPAKERFAAFRDAAETRLKAGTAAWDDLRDWLTLNEVVGDEDRTLEWFDRIRTQPGVEETLERESYRLERLLDERGRWADLTGLWRRPLTKLARAHAQVELADGVYSQLPEEQRRRVTDAMVDSFRQTASRLYAGLLAAGREQEAAQTAEQAIKYDDTPELRLKLVETALSIGQVRPEQSRWLEEASQAGHTDAALSRRLQSAQAIPPSLRDNEIAGMDFSAAIKAWAVRKSCLAAHQDLDAATRARLEHEIEQAAIRLDRLREARGANVAK